MSLDRRAASTPDKASGGHEPRQATSAGESHRRCGDPDATAPAADLRTTKDGERTRRSHTVSLDNGAA